MSGLRHRCSVSDYHPIATDYHPITTRVRVRLAFIGVKKKGFTFRAATASSHSSCWLATASSLSSREIAIASSLSSRDHVGPLRRNGTRCYTHGSDTTRGSGWLQQRCLAHPAREPRLPGTFALGAPGAETPRCPCATSARGQKSSGTPACTPLGRMWSKYSSGEQAAPSSSHTSHASSSLNILRLLCMKSTVRARRS